MIRPIPILSISILVLVAAANAQLSPVIVGVQDIVTLSCGEDIPAPDYANVLVDPDCSSVSLTSDDRLLCQDYKVYEVLTPLYGDEYEIPDWALWLNDTLDFASNHFYWQSERSRLFVSEQNAFLLGYAYDAQAPDKVFEVFLELVGGSDYEEWTSQMTLGTPSTYRTYRDAIGIASGLGGELWNTWSYYETDSINSYVTGEDLFLGSSGSVTHAPFNYLFGFQVGEAASGHNANHGFNTWGIIKGNYNGQEWYAQCDFDGDIVPLGTIGELYCSDVILRTWTATDRCGLSSRSTQLILSEGGSYPGDINADGRIDVEDFLSLNSAFGSSCENCPEDLDGNGVVNIDDFLMFNSYLSNQCE